MRRVISLWLPRFATDRLRLRQRAERGAASPLPLTPSRKGRGDRGVALQHPLPSWEGAGGGGIQAREPHPLVTTVAIGGRSLVACVDALADSAGIAPGMPLADARALAPELATRLADPAGDAAALARLADWCGRYTPLVAVEAMAGPDAPDTGPGLWLDVTGCAHLFGGEAALMADLLGRLRRFGYTAQAGLADTPGAAWAAARFLKEAGDDGAVVAPGAARAALAPLPVAALRLVPAAAAGLDRLGLRRVGELYKLPRATLARRFGDHVGRRLDQALGRLPEPISPRRPAEPHLARVVFAEPVLHAEGLAAGLERLLTRLCRDLDAARLGARRLVLTLYRVDGSLRRAAIGTSRPNRDPAALSRLFAGHMDRLDPGFGVEVMTLEAAAAEVLGALQLVLGRNAGKRREPQRHGDTEENAVMRGLDPRIHPSACANGGMDRRVEPGDDSLPANISVPPCLCGDLKSGTAEIAGLFDRIGNRLGFDRLTRPAPRESHVPERAAARVSVAQEIAPKPWPALRPRPLRLLERPEPIEATALLPDHPPVLFRCGATLHRVVRAEGPERILLEWWHAAPDAADAIATPWRDYFRVEDTDGRRYWVYRETPVEGMARWFLHGQFG